MNEKPLKLLLATAVVICVVAAFGAAATCLLTPVKLPAVSLTDAEQLKKVSATPASAAPVPSLDEFQSVWSKTLHYRPAEDLVAEFDEEDVEETTPLAVELQGTIVEPGHSYAMFGQVGGTVEMLGMGQSARSLDEEFEVVEIVPRRVTVRYEGRLLDITITSENEG